MASPVVSLSSVLIEEYESQGDGPAFPREKFEQRRAELEKEISQRVADPEALARAVDTALVKDFYAWLHENRVRRSALCFSGGGIRSATFGLGLVQGLARRGMLGRFDFLSTVSGGGYLGSWLTGWIHRVRGGGDPHGAVEEVAERLRSLPGSPLEPEAEPLRYLRSYSRYMSPKLGFLSADTWTLGALFLRNLFLNWLVLLPLIAVLLMLPRVSVLFVRLGSRPWYRDNAAWAWPLALWAAIACGIVAIAYIGANRPSLARQSTLPARFRGQGWFLALCLLPLTLMAVLATLSWAWIRSGPIPLDHLRFVVLGRTVAPWLAFALFGVVLHLGGFLLARIWVRKYVPGELAVVVLTGALGGLLTWLAASYLPPIAGPGVTTELRTAVYVCFATPLLLFFFLAAATLFVGISSYFTDDSDREWLARAGAWVLIAMFVRGALSAIVLFGPVAMLKLGAMLCASIGGAAGLVTLVLGRSAKTEARKKKEEQAEEKNKVSLGMNVVLACAAPLFALFVLVVLSLGTTALIQWLTETFAPGHSWHWGELAKLEGGEHLRSLYVIHYSPWWAVAAVAAGLALLGAVMGAMVDINRFSLHAAYRDRLIRAYLGASRGSARRPNPFTGFDEEDNVELKELAGNRPFHVVNMALNLVGGRDLAWQDRKAESFTASPLHCGNLRLGYRGSERYGLHRRGRRAISLGTAVAISGAAASPNMGYHSSPVVTFLLALFNVRLGWWLGNPGSAGDNTYDTPGPRFAPRPFFAEAFGLTSDQHPYVYLSDGGHFENLALYEMVLRRCHFVVLSDGGQDPDFTFEDLGNAVRKIRVDLGVPIEFQKIPMRARPKDGAYDAAGSEAAARPYWALGRIRYSSVDPGARAEDDGLLLYVKPSLNGTEPADVFHYARLHPQFPHESTADQLYSEAQFESYRELGSHVMETILGELPFGAGLEELFQRIEGDPGARKAEAA